MLLKTALFAYYYFNGFLSTLSHSVNCLSNGFFRHLVTLNCFSNDFSLATLTTVSTTNPILSFLLHYFCSFIFIAMYCHTNLSQILPNTLTLSAILLLYHKLETLLVLSNMMKTV